MRRVRIAFVIAELMMLAMNGHPNDRRTFAGQAAKERQQPPHRRDGGKAAVREIAMVSERDADGAA